MPVGHHPAWTALLWWDCDGLQSWITQGNTVFDLTPSRSRCPHAVQRSVLRQPRHPDADMV